MMTLSRLIQSETKWWSTKVKWTNLLKDVTYLWKEYFEVHFSWLSFERTISSQIPNFQAQLLSWEISSKITSYVGYEKGKRELENWYLSFLKLYVQDVWVLQYDLIIIKQKNITTFLQESLFVYCMHVSQ